ncbi:MAG: ankyrin repeat domain-containing protein [Verrucomicrobiae bacterium]|nr:ankyrin repeat domain-containing protein [Verrucomicrobiae bacterium]
MLNRQKQRELIDACFRDVAEAEMLVRSDPNYVQYRDGVGETAFHYVLVENRIDLAAALLKLGSAIDTQDESGATPLMHSVMLGNEELVRWLVLNGAALEPKNANGETALVMATDNEKQSIFRLLIALPRKHSIDFYYDDLSAQNVFQNESLAMRDELMRLGLSQRFDP